MSFRWLTMLHFLPQRGKAGGQMSYSYTCDALYRLTGATVTYMDADQQDGKLHAGNGLRQYAPHHLAKPAHWIQDRWLSILRIGPKTHTICRKRGRCYEDYDGKYSEHQDAIKENCVNFEVTYNGTYNNGYVNGEGSAVTTAWLVPGQTRALAKKLRTTSRKATPTRTAVLLPYRLSWQQLHHQPGRRGGTTHRVRDIQRSVHWRSEKHLEYALALRCKGILRDDVCNFGARNYAPGLSLWINLMKDTRIHFI